jgi:hypothetical protein
MPVSLEGLSQFGFLCRKRRQQRSQAGHAQPHHAEHSPQFRLHRSPPVTLLILPH